MLLEESLNNWCSQADVKMDNYELARINGNWNKKLEAIISLREIDYSLFSKVIWGPGQGRQKKDTIKCGRVKAASVRKLVWVMQVGAESWMMMAGLRV